MYGPERQDSLGLDIVAGSTSKFVIGLGGADVQLGSNSAQSDKEVQSPLQLKKVVEVCEEGEKGTRKDIVQETAGMKPGADEGAWQDQ
jgi:hypothetical protein